MEIKSGKGFYIGDICYVLGNDDYYRFWGKQKRFAEGAFEIPGKGYAFAVGFTAYGDGVYSDEGRCDRHCPVGACGERRWSEVRNGDHDAWHRCA